LNNVPCEQPRRKLGDEDAPSDYRSRVVQGMTSQEKINALYAFYA
jgi:hypothetical protein